MSSIANVLRAKIEFHTALFEFCQKYAFSMARTAGWFPIVDIYLLEYLYSEY